MSKNLEHHLNDFEILHAAIEDLTVVTEAEQLSNVLTVISQQLEVTTFNLRRDLYSAGMCTGSGVPATGLDGTAIQSHLKELAETPAAS